MAGTQRIKLQEAPANREEFIAQMQQWSDKKLEKHLDLFRQQLEVAYKNKDKVAILLLLEYENQVIAARFQNC